jgi:hypothetical protein
MLSLKVVAQTGDQHRWPDRGAANPRQVGIEEALEITRAVPDLCDGPPLNRTLASLDWLYARAPE